MLTKKILFLQFFLMFTYVSLGLHSVFSAQDPVIAVIRSRIIGPYNEALFGFEEELNRNGYKTLLHRYDLESFQGKESQLIEELRDLKPDLVYAIGTEAALFAKDNFKNLPVVFSMVLNPVKSKLVESLELPSNNLTGVSLDILPEVQFKKLKEVMPKVKRIGILYNAKEKDWIKEAETAAGNIGLLIVAKPINSISDVPRMLDEISKEADCLWAQVEPLIYNTQSAQYILLTLLRNKIPSMVFSSQYVKAGAVLALECDYKDIGRQSKQIVEKILNGKNPGSIPIATPEKMRLVVNQKIAQLIGIDIPKKLLEEAAEVY